LTARSETTGFTSEPDDDAARLRGDIERTREQMSATIDELEARLRPSNLLSQAKETVKVKATDTMNRVVSNASDTAERAAGQARTSARAASDWVQAHPLYTAAAVSGLIWAARRQRSRASGVGYRRVSSNGGSHESPVRILGAFAAGAAAAALLPSMGGAPARAVSQSTRTVTDAGREAARTVRDRAAEVGDSVARAGRSVQEQAGEYIEEVSERALDTGTRLRASADHYSLQLRERTSDIQRRVENWMDSDPLLAGAAAVAAGVVVGLSLPVSEAEHRAMGEARDAVVQRAADAARGLRDRAGAVAQELVDEVRTPSQEVG